MFSEPSLYASTFGESTLPKEDFRAQVAGIHDATCRFLAQAACVSTWLAAMTTSKQWPEVGLAAGEDGAA